MTRPLPGRQSDDGERLSHSGGDAALLAKTTTAGDAEQLISFEEAARILGMGERSLRKIIQPSRERIEGRWTSGQTIRFLAWFKKGSGTVAGTARRVLRTTVPDPLLNHARFFQVHPKAAIKFRPEWLDEFIFQHTHDPGAMSRRLPDVPQRKTKELETAGFGLQGGTAEPDLGFDSQLYDL